MFLCVPLAFDPPIPVHITISHPCPYHNLPSLSLSQSPRWKVIVSSSLWISAEHHRLCMTKHFPEICHFLIIMNDLHGAEWNDVKFNSFIFATLWFCACCQWSKGLCIICWIWDYIIIMVTSSLQVFRFCLFDVKTMMLLLMRNDWLIGLAYFSFIEI